MESDRPLSARCSLLFASVEWFPFACLFAWGGSRWGTALSDAHRHALALLQPVVVEVPGAPWKREQEATSSYGWFPASMVPFRRGGARPSKAAVRLLPWSVGWAAWHCVEKVCLKLKFDVPFLATLVDRRQEYYEFFSI